MRRSRLHDAGEVSRAPTAEASISYPRSLLGKVAPARLRELVADTFGG
jgi:hypothetical protein